MPFVLIFPRIECSMFLTLVPRHFIYIYIDMLLIPVLLCLTCLHCYHFIYIYIYCELTNLLSQMNERMGDGMGDRMVDRMGDYMGDRMGERMPEREMECMGGHPGMWREGQGRGEVRIYIFIIF